MKHTIDFIKYMILEQAREIEQESGNLMQILGT